MYYRNNCAHVLECFRNQLNLSILNFGELNVHVIKTRWSGTGGLSKIRDGRGIVSKATDSTRGNISRDDMFSGEQDC